MPAFYLQHPTAGLLALLSVFVPVAIYLWNRRPGRVVQVGSLRWLETAANRRLRSLKPEGLLLLLVRAAILSLLALALAEPGWLGQVPPRRGQILLSPAASAEAVSSLRPTLDSLLRQGYQLRELRPGLPLVAPDSQNSKLAGRSAPSLGTAQASLGHSAPENVWAQVQQAADSFPNRPLVVVAPLALRSFRGTRPMLPANITWRPTPASPDSVVQVAAAWQPRPDSLLLLLAYSTEMGTTFRRVRLGRPSAGLLPRLLPAPSEVRYVAANGQPALQVTGPAQTATIPVQTTRTRFWISADASHTAEARVWKAALRAAGSVAPVTPEIIVSSSFPTLADSVAGVFWLQEGPVPVQLQQQVRQGLRLWQEAPPPGKPVSTSLAVASEAPVRILRHDTLPVPRAGWVLWQDAHGKPLLSVQQQGNGQRYHLHTRLTQPWSELADSPELPALLLPYLWPTTSGPVVTDMRVLDPAQALFQLAKPAIARDSTAQVAGAGLAANQAPAHSYTPWLVLAAGMLFGLERWLAARRSAQSSPASV